MRRTWLVALTFVLAACGGSSQLGVQATMPDPPAPRDDAPTHERPDFFWIHGHWLWDTNRWDWLPGRWEHVRSGYTWTEGRWERRGAGWTYVDGTWAAGEAPATPP